MPFVIFALAFAMTGIFFPQFFTNHLRHKLEEYIPEDSEDECGR